MANGSAEDKARKARNKANETFGGVSRYDTENIVKKIAKNSGVTLTQSETKRAADLAQTRRQNDRDRTAARATFIAGPNSPASKQASASRMEASIGGAPQKQTPTRTDAGVKTTTKTVNKVYRPSK